MRAVDGPPASLFRSGGGHVQNLVRGPGRGKTASFRSEWASKHVISVELGLQTLKSHRVGLQGCRWSYCLAAIMDQFIYEN